MWTRRELLQWTATGAAAWLGTGGLAGPQRLLAQAPAGFTLPKLPYPYDALEPHIDAETMMIHHTRHHQAYIDNLNKALAEAAPDWLRKDITEIVRHYNSLPEKIRTAVRNNGGGHLNHDWFWKMMAKPNSTAPRGELLKAIEASFGSLDGFKKEFLAAALGRFGSGWAWLILGREKPLAVTSTPNQDNPITDGQTVLLGCDVWEHAYYLKYRNARAKYVEAWFHVVNWDEVAERFAQARK